MRLGALTFHLIDATLRVLTGILADVNFQIAGPKHYPRDDEVQVVLSLVSERSRRSARGSYSNEVYGIIEADREDDSDSLFPRKIGERRGNLVKSGRERGEDDKR